MISDTNRFTGELPQETSPDFLETVSRIKSSWQKQTESVLETARLVKEARDKFSGMTEVLIKQLAFERTLFHKLCKIGDNARLYDQRNLEKLPAGYSLLWELTKLDNEDFKTAIDTGAIHPLMKRADIAKLVKPAEPARPKRSPNSLLNIKVDWSIPEYQKSEFQKWLRDGQDRFKGIVVNWPDDNANIESSLPSPISSPTTQPVPDPQLVAEIDAALDRLEPGSRISIRSGTRA